MFILSFVNYYILHRLSPSTFLLCLLIIITGARSSAAMEDSAGDGTAMRNSKTYCVTGGSGFIGSWLIKSLLRRGYSVHATVRHPGASLFLDSFLQPLFIYLRTT